jgi:hypothetical protein
MRRLLPRFAILLIVAGGHAACRREPAQPDLQPDRDVVSGPRRLEWDQPALAGTDVASYRFVIHVDGLEKELADATCGELLQSGSHLCTAELPALSAGRHVIALAAVYEKAGRRFESRRSVSLEIETR